MEPHFLQNSTWGFIGTSGTLISYYIAAATLYMLCGIIMGSGVAWETGMKAFDTVRLDAKGRIIVPFHIREYLGLKEGMELLVSNNEKKELLIHPLHKKTARISILLHDYPGALSSVLDALARQKIDILMSASKTVERGKLAEWHALVDISACRNAKKLGQQLNALAAVKKVSIESG